MQQISRFTITITKTKLSSLIKTTQLSWFYYFYPITNNTGLTKQKFI